MTAPSDAVTLALTGDVMLGRLVNEVVGPRGAAYPWGTTLDLLRAADLTLINLECVIAEGGEPWTRTPKVFHFRAGPWAIDSLHLAGVDAVTLANNHTLDYGEAALLEMLGHLERSGIRYTGAGQSLEEAARPAILQADGVRIGVVAFTDNQPEWAATSSSPGVLYTVCQTGGEGVETLQAAIAAARQQADLVVCSAHWGPNMRVRPPESFRTFAHHLIDRGVDVFYGHSAHVFQGIEVYRGKPILYDTGDYVDDYAVDPELRNDRSFLFSLRIEGQRVKAIDLIPVLIGYCQVNRATGSEFTQTCRRMGELSAEMGTELAETPQGLQLRL